MMYLWHGSLQTGFALSEGGVVSDLCTDMTWFSAKSVVIDHSPVVKCVLLKLRRFVIGFALVPLACKMSAIVVADNCTVKLI